MDDIMEELKKRMKKLEKENKELKNRFNLLDSRDSENKIITINYLSNRKQETALFDKYDVEKIRKYFRASDVFQCFTKGNTNLFAGYYYDGITGSTRLVLHDSESKVEETILELGLSE